MKIKNLIFLFLLLVPLSFAYQEQNLNYDSNQNNIKKYIVSAQIGIFIYLIYILLVALIAPIVGIKTKGILYLTLNLLDYTIGLPYNLTVKIYEILGCVTSPCLLWNTLTSFLTYSIFGIFVYSIWMFIKIRVNKK